MPLSVIPAKEDVVSKQEPGGEAIFALQMYYARLLPFHRDHPGTQRPAYQPWNIMNIQFLHDVFAMDIDSLRTELQLLRGFFAT